MACGVALKRPYDYEAYVSPDDATDVKRRCTDSRCSPFRPFLGTLAASLPTASSAPTTNKFCSENGGVLNDASPFASAANRIQLSPGQLQSYLKAEVRYLKRRRLLPKRLFVECASDEAVQQQQRNGLQRPDAASKGSSANGYRSAPRSPIANSGSDSDGETPSASTMCSRNAAAEVSIFDKPQFSLKHVQLVCERLLKQQEVRIRFEYEAKLNGLLQEQHDQFVQFTREQERQQSSAGIEEFSYYS